LLLRRKKISPEILLLDKIGPVSQIILL